MMAQPSDGEILNMQRDVMNAIIGKLNAVRKDGPTTEAVELLLKRLMGSVNSLAVLRNDSPHDFRFDGAHILRGVYDAALQAMYILCDAEKRDERAKLYLDFYWIEKKRLMDRYLKESTTLSNHIAGSTRRKGGEAAITAKFDEVKANYLTHAGDVQPNWYKGNLSCLAKEVGLHTEYEILNKQLSGVVHSSALTLKGEVPYNGFLLVDLACRMAFRVLGLFCEYKGIVLEGNEADMVREAKKNLLDWDSAPGASTP